MTFLEQTPSERAREVRAELEAIVAALRVDALTELVAHGRVLLDREVRPVPAHSR